MTHRGLPGTDGTTVVTMEMQRGIVGDLATMPQLAEVAERTGFIRTCARLVGAARSSRVPVVHATVSWRADRLGTSLNAPLSAALARNPQQILDGSPAVELLAEFGDTSGDLISHRHHGLTPFSGTNLDATLRALGTRTVVACGVSVNVGIMGLVLNAADLGYHVVVCTDAVAGVPEDYTHAVFDNTFRMVATLTTTDELLGSWA